MMAMDLEAEAFIFHSDTVRYDWNRTV